jgi:hypothetical protein
MRIVRNLRLLSALERKEAESVFATSLPDWKRIYVTDGLGPVPFVDRPYTDELYGMFRLNLGPDVYPDALADQSYTNLLIHELTHVWQYDRGYWVVLRSAYANRVITLFSAGYHYTLDHDDTWNSYNVEQQAQLIQDWYDRGRSTTDVRLPFIKWIIRYVPWNQFAEVPLRNLRKM